MHIKMKIISAITCAVSLGAFANAEDQDLNIVLTRVRSAISKGGSTDVDIDGGSRIRIATDKPDGAAISPLRIVVAKRLEIPNDGKWSAVVLDEILERVKIYCHAASAVKASPYIRIELTKEADSKILEGLIKGIVSKSKGWEDPPGPVKALYFKTHDPAEKPERFVPLAIPDIDPYLLNRIEAEQDGTVQPATRPESKSEGSDKPQPEAEGRSR
jgi:hypothetical protein